MVHPEDHPAQVHALHALRAHLLSVIRVRDQAMTRATPRRARETLPQRHTSVAVSKVQVVNQRTQHAAQTRRQGARAGPSCGSRLTSET
jgi:hypothetical protein